MTLSDLIKQHVTPLVENNNGWYATRCMVCDDHQIGSANFKGLRGNFKLDNDNIIGYHCYNCDTSARYDPTDETKSKSFSKNILKIFESFCLPEIEYNKILLELFGNTAKTSIKEINPLKVEPDELKLPDHFYSLRTSDPNDKWTIISNHYLNNRMIDPNSYDFYLSNGTGKFGKKWKGRIIFPIYKDSKLVFYQGRALVPNIKRYENPSTNKSAVLYNYNEIFTISKKPLFIVEGFFDAHLINGVALMGKNITKEQTYWLSKTKRIKIIIPDKEGDGRRIALQAIKLGWSISCPNFGKCKDINEAYTKYGKIYVISEIMSNIFSGSEAEMMIELYVND